jgi:Protein of unknown function (DUF2961)
MFIRILCGCLIASVLAQVADAQSLFTIPDNVETRWASPENPKGEKGRAAQSNGGRKGSPSFPLKAGEQRILAEASAVSGTIRRIWVTISDRSPKMLRGLRLDFYWDGAKTPAVSAPLGDFFGMGLGQMAIFQSALFASPEGRSFNCYIPMPFRTGMKMIVTNETDTDLRDFYYDVDYTLGDKHGADVLYFHTYFHRENPTKMQQDYELLPSVDGKGRFLGVNVGVIVNQERYFKSWWGEGEVKVYLDGDNSLPTLSGTGSEDYVGTGWGLSQYANQYQGCLVADGEKMRYSFYRYHVPDPIYFRRDVRVTIQQIGITLPKEIEAFSSNNIPLYKAGPGLVEMDKKRLRPYELFEREDDWSSCAYFYLDKPENRLPRLAAVGRRTEGL